jgi:2-polyprenyl-3-methyl-5-hydroxy-6-metoxy-1,4-benzoquinol methylase
VETAKGYWDHRYTLAEGIIHHAKQNEQLAHDLVKELRKRPRFLDAIKEKLVIEVGCGTGDLCSILTDNLYCAVHGTDLSAFGVEIAKIRFPHLLFTQHDILRDAPPGSYELAIASNVVEHFKDPNSVIEKMFALAPKVVIVAPFNQALADGYNAEGGAGHASCINHATFHPYKVEYSFTFRSDGWSCSESSHQIAALLSLK